MRWAVAAVLVLASPATAPAKAGPPLLGERAYDCVIEPQQVVKLAPAVVGVLTRLDVDRGDLVRKGQVLGKLEDGVEAANLLLARARATNDNEINAGQARLTFLRRKFDRAAQLVGDNIVSRNTTEEAEADMRVAEHQLRLSELNRAVAVLEVKHSEELLRQRILVSPLDGVVTERLLSPGEYRNEQSPVLTLAQVDPLRVEAFLPTALYGQVRPGMAAQVQPEAPIEGAHTANVTVVDRVMDAASGTFGVRLSLANADLALPAGIRCKLSFAAPPGAPGLAAR